jgi:hypothetical protein
MTSKNLVQELLIKKNELLAVRAVQVAQDEEDWCLKKIRIMRQTSDNIDSGIETKAEALTKKATTEAITKRATEDAVVETPVVEVTESVAKAQTDRKAKAKANEDRIVALGKLRGRSPGAVGGRSTGRSPGAARDGGKKK